MKATIPSHLFTLSAILLSGVSQVHARNPAGVWLDPKEDLCCDTSYSWSPFSYYNTNDDYWGWQYCCLPNSDADHNGGCRFDDDLKVGRTDLNVKATGTCHNGRGKPYWVATPPPGK